MAWLAAVAAANRRREEEEEETRMVEQLRKDDPDNRFEYKILRSSGSAFGKADRRSQILMEESRAGWEMGMMLDNTRLILRREKKLRDQDLYLESNIDPYRIEIDSSRAVLFGLAIAMTLGIGVMLFALLITGSQGPRTALVPAYFIMGVIVILMVVAGVFAAKKHMTL